jgi:hypothetical protein
MKYILLMAIALTSCARLTRTYKVFLINGSYSQTIIDCDSVKMQSQTRATVYVNGTATEVFADKIMVSTN